jgi:hypothetical protein
VHQDGLCLIVGVVTHGDGPGTDLLGDTPEESIARPARSFFESQALVSGQGGQIQPLDADGQTPIGGQSTDVLGVVVSFRSAQAVVEVGDVEIQIVVSGQTAEEMEKAEGIGAARDADDDRLPRLQEPILFY